MSEFLERVLPSGSVVHYVNYKTFRWYDVAQGSDEWFELRRGIPTASDFKRIITPAKGELSKQCDDYACKLVYEKHSEIIPEGAENYTSRPMWWGSNTEHEARAWYALESKLGVEWVRAKGYAGFCTTLDGRFGCSPDGLVKGLRGLELKCPMGETHVSYCLAGVLPTEYKPQVHGGLFICGALEAGLEEWDFVSYFKDLPKMRIRVQPDDYTKRVRDALEAFDERLREVEEIVLNGGQP